MGELTIIQKVKRDNIDRAQKVINKYMEDLETENINLKNIITTYNKEIEIENLNETITNLRRHALHISTDKEITRRKQFSQLHYKKCNSNIEITIIGTGLGNVLKVKCNKCGEQEDITDIDSW